jgi:hypothetical protein
MHQFHKFILSWNSTCFGEFVCPSSGVYSLYTQQWYMSYRFVDSCRTGAHAPARQLLSLRLINSWWTDELSETCRISWQNKFVKLVHLVGFIINKYIASILTLFGNFVGCIGEWLCGWTTGFEGGGGRLKLSITKKETNLKQIFQI